LISLLQDFFTTEIAEFSLESISAMFTASADLKIKFLGPFSPKIHFKSLVKG
jgi:hypothetical protein